MDLLSGARVLEQLFLALERLSARKVTSFVASGLSSVGAVVGGPYAVCVFGGVEVHVWIEVPTCTAGLGSRAPEHAQFCQGLASAASLCCVYLWPELMVP